LDQLFICNTDQGRIQGKAIRAIAPPKTCK